jgi:hypothetical protein
MKKIFFMVLVLTSLALAQGLGDDPQKVKDAYVDCTLYAQQLAMENAKLNADLQRVLKDLTLIKTITQLDSLKKVYGIVKEGK